MQPNSSSFAFLLFPGIISADKFPVLVKKGIAQKLLLATTWSRTHLLHTSFCCIHHTPLFRIISGRFSTKIEMATIETLKQALRQKAASHQQQPLSEAQYNDGLETLARDATAYQDFIVPQLRQLLTSLADARSRSISVLEIGPGPKTVLASLPRHLRNRVELFEAFEPNTLFATKLEASLKHSFPSLKNSPHIYHGPFTLDSIVPNNSKFDVVMFCHSMYNMKPKADFIRRAMTMLNRNGMVVVCHRDGLAQHLDGLVCQQFAFWPTGSISVTDGDDSELDAFASLVAGFTVHDAHVLVEWRKTCQTLGIRHDKTGKNLVFRSPEVMIVLNQHAETALSDLAAQGVLLAPSGERLTVKNPEARLRLPAAIARPTEISHIQKCVRWALRNKVGLTVVGGTHSSQCLWPAVVAVDMAAFKQIHRSESDSLLVADAGCKTGDIIRQAVARGVTVPLGARPSVGAGLWLQGGIGHLTRRQGLTCDAIVGAVMISVATGDILCIGRVPREHQPQGAMRPANEDNLLWAIKGAGTNFGIVVSVAFKTSAAPNYTVRNWVIPLQNEADARKRLSDFDSQVASLFPRHCSADAFLYWDAGQMQLGVTVCHADAISARPKEAQEPIPFQELAAFPAFFLGFSPRGEAKTVDGVGLFDTEMYMSELHGGHGSGKTSAFKRCVFLKDIHEACVANALVAAVQARPSPLCYLHLLQGGEAMADLAADATAFGCRDWEFACVITGVWPRGQHDGTDSAVSWVYDVVRDLLALPQSRGVYGADLGPDPRDSTLAMRAFGPNRPRLARLKRDADPQGVLAYTCPLSSPDTETPKLIVLVTGDSCAGKDYCASIWARLLTQECCAVRVVSISDATKRKYASATPGIDLDHLLHDRAYKEQHRPALTAFHQEQVRQRPRSLEEHFLEVVSANGDVDVLFITGMRDEAPVTALSPLVAHSKLLDVRVRAGGMTRQSRGGRCDSASLPVKESGYRPSLIFDNDAHGAGAAETFGRQHLLSLVHPDLDRLATLVRTVHDFPRKGISFRHVLNIAQQPGGLMLCTSLLQKFLGSIRVGAVAASEAGGFVFASALAHRAGVPLLLARAGGKLPRPTVTVDRDPSHISGTKHDKNGGDGSKLEMNCPAGLPAGASVIVVDDVLASGKTLCAMLRLLEKAGVKADGVIVLVVAEFPAHRGRELLRSYGFGVVKVQNLLVFGGL